MGAVQWKHCIEKVVHAKHRNNSKVLGAAFRVIKVLGLSSVRYRGLPRMAACERWKSCSAKPAGHRRRSYDCGRT